MERKFMKLGFLVVMALILIYSLVIVDHARAQEAKEPYLFGAPYSLTGKFGVYGISNQQGVVYAATEVNKRGGIHGRPVKVIFYDCEGDVTKGLMNVRRLVEEDKVHFLLGPNMSGTSIAALPIIQKAGIPTIVPSSAIEVTEPPRKWVFQCTTPSIYMHEEIMAHCKHKGITKVVVLGETSYSGESQTKMALEWAPKFGITIVAAEKFGDADVDMTAQLTKIKAAKPEALWIFGAGRASGPIAIKNARMLGFEVIYCRDWQSFATLELAGEAAEGILHPGTRVMIGDSLPDNDPHKAGVKIFNDGSYRLFGRKPDIYGAIGYDGAMMLFEAVKRAGPDFPPDRAKVRDEIEKTKDYFGVFCRGSASPSKHCLTDRESIIMTTVKNGKWVFVPWR